MQVGTATDFPLLQKRRLIDMAGWEVVKEASDGIGQCSFENVLWQERLLSGAVKRYNQTFWPKLRFREALLPENQCNCEKGRKGYMCSHTIALYLYYKQQLEAAVNCKEPITIRREVKSIKVVSKKGKELSFRIILPPNWREALNQHSIFIKVEAKTTGDYFPIESLSRTIAYKLQPHYEDLLIKLEEWSSGILTSVLQLGIEQFRKLLFILKNHPVAYLWGYMEAPLSWDDGILVEAESLIEHLKPNKLETVSNKSLPSKVQQVSNYHKSKSLQEKSNVPIKSLPIAIEGSFEYVAITIPNEETNEVVRFKGLLCANGFNYEPKRSQWTLRGRHAILNFMAKHWKSLEKHYKLTIGDHFQVYLNKLQFSAMSVVIEDATIHKAQVRIFLDDPEWNEKAINNALARGQLYLEGSNRILLLENDTLEDITHLQQMLSGNKSKNTSGTYNQVLERAEVQFVLDFCKDSDLSVLNRSKQFLQVISGKEGLSLAPVSQLFNEKLRVYQRIGVAWLFYLYQHQLGGILADEMGLGKTIQAIALLDSVFSNQQHTESNVKRCLILAPASLVENWRREIQAFLPSIDVGVYHGSSKDDTIFSQAIPIILTSYTTLTLNEALFQRLNYEIIIADEGQWIKNRSTQAAQSLKLLKGNAKFILTGTPIENSITDLFSLFEFILPGYLKSLPKNVSIEEKDWFHDVLKRQAAPYIFRRTKLQVAPELPEKVNQIFYCQMTDKQKLLYQSVKRIVQEKLFESASNAPAVSNIYIFQELLRLRQICVEPRILDKTLLAADSAKLMAFQELVAEAIESGSRILVFSQFVEALGYLKQSCQEQQWPYLYLDGSTPNRVALCEQFNKSKEIPLFLISLKAGGVGLNLTGADTVFIYDPWWNPALEAQAIDRAHRLGQVKTVTGIKFITTDSVEEKVLALQNKKQVELDQLWEMNQSLIDPLNLDVLKSIIN